MVMENHFVFIIVIESDESYESLDKPYKTKIE